MPTHICKWIIYHICIMYVSDFLLFPKWLLICTHISKKKKNTFIFHVWVIIHIHYCTENHLFFHIDKWEYCCDCEGDTKEHIQQIDLRVMSYFCYFTQLIFMISLSCNHFEVERSILVLYTNKSIYQIPEGWHSLLLFTT